MGNPLNITTRARRGTLTAVLALALTALLSSTVAQAAQLRYADATGDVVKVDLASRNPHFVSDPSRKNGDIKNAFVHYRKGHLVLRTNFVELKPARNTLLEFTGEIRTPHHRRWAYDVMTSPGRWAGHDMFINERSGRVCGIGHMFDYAENFTRVAIPLRCLGNPRWVQVRMGAVTYSFDPAVLRERHLKPGQIVFHGDLAESNGVDHSPWTPRVHRG